MKQFLTKQKEYLKWLFRKPQISFNRKPSGKEVMKLIKEQNLYELGKLLPQFRLGKKRLSRLQSLLLLGGGIGLGVLASVFIGSPLIFFGLTIISYGTNYLVFEYTGVTNNSISLLDSTHFVVVYDDGNNHGYAKIGVVSGTPADDISYGTGVEFNNASTDSMSVAALDSTHFVIAYRDVGGSNHGQGVVGVVSSGTTITFGTVYEFLASAVNTPDVATLDSTHFVIAYKQGSDDHGYAIIGVVSNDDDIAYGTAYEFNNAATLYPRVSALSATSFVISYRLNTDQTGKAIIGTVSGTPADDITYGSVYEFAGATVYLIDISTLDSTHFVVVYKTYTTGYSYRAIIGTVSGTPLDDIAFGSSYEFDNISANSTSISVSLLDSTHFVTSWSATSGHGQSIIGTIASVNQISFGTIYEFYNSYAVFGVNVSYLSTTSFVVSFAGNTNSNYIYSIIGSLVEPPPTNIKTYNTNLAANIKSINTNAIANVKSLNTNTNV